MHVFSPRPWFGWIAHALGRNPLLRWTDRVEAWVIVFAILAALAATPVCALAAAGVYRSHHQLYAAQSSQRRTVTATVVEMGPPQHKPHTTGVTVLVMWLAGDGGARGGENYVAHTEWTSTDRAVNLGDRTDIWVNEGGAPAAPPTPPSQAGIDALGFGAGIWFVVTLGLTVVVGAVRSPLNRIRHVQWEREIKGFADGGTSQHLH
jgi:hypothetical protein